MKIFTFIVLLIILSNYSYADDKIPTKEDKKSNEFRVPDNVRAIEEKINELESEKKKKSSELKELENSISDYEKKKNEFDGSKLNNDFIDILTTSLKKNDLTTLSEKIGKFDQLYNIFRDEDTYWNNNNEQEFDYNKIIEKKKTEFNKFYYDNLPPNFSYVPNNLLSEDKSYIKNALATVKYFTSEMIDKFNLKIDNIFDELINNLKEHKEKLTKELDIINSNLDKLYSASDVDKSINSKAIMWGIPSFCITVIILFLLTIVIKRNAAIENRSDDLSRVLLELITVLLLTLTILILGLSKILTENVLGTLLGGIAGYILNRTGNKTT